MLPDDEDTLYHKSHIYNKAQSESGDSHRTVEESGPSAGPFSSSPVHLAASSGLSTSTSGEMHANRAQSVLQHIFRIHKESVLKKFPKGTCPASVNKTEKKIQENVLIRRFKKNFAPIP